MGSGCFWWLTRIPGKHHAKKLQKVVAAEAQGRVAEEACKTKEQQKQRWRQDRDAREQKDAASRQSMLLRQAAQNTVLAANVSLDFDSNRSPPSAPPRVTVRAAKCPLPSMRL